MLLGFASLVLGIAAASVSRTVAAAAAAGRAAGAAFARGFGAVRAGMSRVTAGILRSLATFRVAWARMIGSIIAGGGVFAAARRAGASLGRAITGGIGRAWAGMTAPFARGLASMRVAWSRAISRIIAGGGIFRMGRASGARLGRSIVSGLGQGIAGAAGVLQRVLTSPVALAIGAVAAVIAPAAGAALGAAITAAVGIGVMAAGVAIAAKQSDRVQAAFRDAFAPIGKELSETAMVAFEGPLIQSAGRFKQAWQQVGPVVKSAMTQSASFVQPLTDGLAQMVEKMVGGGGFTKLMAAAKPVIDQVAIGLSRMGDAFDNMFESIASAGPGLTKGMIVIFAIVTSSIVALGNTIEFLSKAFDRGTEFAQRYAEVFATMLGWLPGVGDLWRSAAEGLGLFNDSANMTRSITPIASAATAGMSGAFNQSAAAAERARKALSDLTEKISGLINAQLGADQAALAFQRALDAVTESIKQNGKSIDITTAKGQANIDVVLQAVGAANAKREADIKLAGGEKASAAAIQAANAAFQAQIAQLEATLRKMGMTQAQIDALLGKYRQLAAAPNIQKTVTVTTYFREVGGPNYAKQSGNQIAYAKGTKSALPGVALVGEYGPELVKFKGGEEVMTAQDTSQLLRGRELSYGSAADMSALGRAPTATATMERPAVNLRIAIGNREIKDYVVEVADERADARTATMARRLNGR